MPLIKLKVSDSVLLERKDELLRALSQLVQECIGKPEKYVMATLETASIQMSGTTQPAALAEVRSIGGLGSEVNRKLAVGLCSMLDKSLKIPPDRVYICYSDVAPDNWGWNGRTFG